MDDRKRAQLTRLRERRTAERRGDYRPFESGTSKALMRSHFWIRLDDALTDAVQSWIEDHTPSGEPVEFETTDLPKGDWYRLARDLMRSSGESQFMVLAVFGSARIAIGALASADAVIDILEEVLDRHQDVTVSCLSTPGGFEFDASYEPAHIPDGVFSVSAWGTMTEILIRQLESETATWFRIPEARHNGAAGGGSAFPEPLCD